MILVGETDDDAREVWFRLTIAGVQQLARVFVAGDVVVCAPGATFANADVTRIVEKGLGVYAYRLTDAQVAEAGKFGLRIDTATFDDIGTVWEDIQSASRFGTAGPFVVSGSRAVTLLELRNRVLRRGGVEFSADLTPEVLNDYINEAITELWDILRVKADDALVTSTTLATTIGDEVVELPEAFYKLRKLMIADSSAPSGWRRLRSTSLDASHQFTTLINKRYRYRIQQGDLILAPIPQAVESLRLYYIPLCPVLVADDDLFDGFNGYEELAVQLAWKRCLVRQDLSTESVDAEINRLTGRISAAADGRDVEPFYLDIRGSRLHDDEELEMD